MPQINRDKDSIYPPGRLSVWFLATSAVLVLVLGWLVAADHFGRPWKSIQRGYFERRADLLAVQRELLGVATFGDNTEEGKARAAALREKQKALVAAQAKYESAAARPERATLEAELVELKKRMVEADNATKAAKALYSATKYQYQEAEHGKHEARAKELMEELGSLGERQLRAEKSKYEDEVRARAVTAKLEVLAKERDEAQAAVDEAMKTYEAVRVQLEEERAKTQANTWRNAPVADIVNPSIRIEKSVPEFLHEDFVFDVGRKVDMCMTCHRGIDEKQMTETEVRRLLLGRPAAGEGQPEIPGWIRFKAGEKAWPALEAAIRTDAGLAPPWRDGALKARLVDPATSIYDLVPRAAFAKAFGIEGYDAAAPDAAKDREIDARVEQVFGEKDPLATFRIAPVHWAHPHLGEILGSGSHKMKDVGCTICHQGAGRRLDFGRAAHWPGDEEQRERWEHEHGWSERDGEYEDFKMLPLAYVQGQCVKCHGPALPYPAPSEELIQWESAIERGKSVTVRKPAPKAVAGTASDVDGRWRPERMIEGVRILREYGCVGCHPIKQFGDSKELRSFGDVVGYPRAEVKEAGGDFSAPVRGTLTAGGYPKVGWDLTYLADKTTRDFVERWILNPQSFRIDTRMPSFYWVREHAGYVPLVDERGAPKDTFVVVDGDARDKARADVEVKAITEYLFTASKSRKETYVEPPKGDAHAGARTFYTAGCYACHVGRGTWDDAKGAYGADASARAVQPTGLLPGPRLTAMGSKTNAKALFAWLAEPRHYWSTTAMPKIGWRDEFEADGKTVKRSAEQVRADVVAYLMEGRDEAFEALPRPQERWTREHELALDDFWTSAFGTGKDPAVYAGAPTLDAADAESRRRAREQKLSEVGKYLIGYRGCFSCHNVAGYEDAQPIGKDLTKEGSEDLHRFDFGRLGHDGVVEETRWAWIEKKLAEPRVFDKGLFKPRWNDRLRMPRFNLTAEQRTAVTAVVLGLMDGKTIDPQARAHDSAACCELERGRRVVERYHCTQCHSIEGLAGYATSDQLAKGFEGWMLPPNLYGEGDRRRAEWLFGFLKQPVDLRPGVIQRMPTFRLADEEVTALLDYFKALAHRRDRLASDPQDAAFDTTPYAQPVTIRVQAKDAEGNPVTREVVAANRLDEARGLFRTMNCDRCHLPKGTPGADPNEGASAPPFPVVGKSLHRAWVRDLVQDPQNRIQGTKMPAFWPLKSARFRKPGDTRSIPFPEFRFGLGEDATPDEVSAAQMDAITRYVLYHYEAPDLSPSEPK